jgi:DNA ligase (NAD+)
VFNDLVELADVIARMTAAGVNMVEEAPAPSTVAQTLAGRTVCISGKIGDLTRDEARNAAESLGASSVSSVSARTNLLIAGPGAGSKLARAEELGVDVMSPEEFLSLLAAT